MGSLDPEAFERSINRLERLENEPPDTGQLKRYAAMGAVISPAASLLEKVISGDDILVRDYGSPPGADGKRKILPGRSVRSQAAKMVGGAITGGALPMLRHHMDRLAERNELRKQIAEIEKENALGSLLDPSKTAAITARQRLYRSQRIGKHHTSLVGEVADAKGPSIAQLAKPKGYGQPIPGAGKLHLGDVQRSPRPRPNRHRQRFAPVPYRAGPREAAPSRRPPSAEGRRSPGDEG